MKIATASKNDYTAIRNLWDTCFDEDSIKWRDWYFNSIFEPANANILYEDKELISMVHMNPYLLMLNGKCIRTAAMAGVATNPHYRNHSYADKLIKHSLTKAYNDGYEYSFLRPFNYEFYKKYGYSCAYNAYSYEIQYKIKNELPKDFEISLYTKNCNDALCNVYDIATQNSNGYVKRDAKYFNKYIKSFLVDNCKVYIFKSNHQTGYFIYDSDNRKVEELFFTGNLITAYHLVCGYLQHTVVIKNQPNINIDENNIKSAQKKHCMVRIINFVKLIEKFKFTDSRITITIKDDIIKENNQNFLITAKNSVTSVTPIQDYGDIIMSINEVSAIIACGNNYNQPVDLKEYFTAKGICKSSFIVEEC